VPEFSALLHAALSGFAAIVLIGFVTWLISIVCRDVSIVDRVWPIFMLAAGLTYACRLGASGARAGIVLMLVAVWALRLSGYITWRNWGGEEDRRYQEIRARNQPGFAFKSLYLIFALQAVLAWIIASPLLVAVAGQSLLGWLDAVGITLAAFGIVFESIADMQMMRFKAHPENKGIVMDRGLWHYTRHPNYFGESCTWWGFCIIALAAGGALDNTWSGAWAVISPVVLTLLLLKVSGVSLLEKDIGERRPAYREYIQRTNAFLPSPPRKGGK
jgi:steroid 5-alpha reductase family enzyme